MNEEMEKDLERIMAEHERMEAALKAINQAAKIFKPVTKTQQKHALGIAIGLSAARAVASKVLKENEDGRQEETRST